MFVLEKLLTALFKEEATLPVVDALEGLFELAQDLWGRWPLQVPSVVLHGSDVFEAAGDLANVRLHFVAPVGPQDDEGRSHPPVPHPGDGAPPHLQTRHVISTHVTLINEVLK